MLTEGITIGVLIRDQARAQNQNKNDISTVESSLILTIRKHDDVRSRLYAKSKNFSLMERK
jgi:hypothetical protein